MDAPWEASGVFYHKEGSVEGGVLLTVTQTIEQLDQRFCIGAGKAISPPQSHSQPNEDSALHRDSPPGPEEPLEIPHTDYCAILS